MNNDYYPPHLFTKLYWLSVIGLLLFLLLHSCARLPEYATPKFTKADEGAIPQEQGFRYRQLELDDFQAASLPGDAKQYAKRIHARSCLSIRPGKDTRAQINSSEMTGSTVWTGSYVALSFEAIFRPKCSWWNPRVPKKRRGYVLEHEQIHFALTELSARNLSKRAKEELKDYIAVGNSYEDVRNQLVEKVQSLSQEAMEKDIKQQTRFDEDTSMVFDKKSQRRWLKKIEKELAETPPQ